MGGRSTKTARRPRAGPRRRPPTEAERAKAAEVRARLSARYPDAGCALEHRNAFELLVATILSAQCTDARVNMVTPALFYRWPTPAALARAERGEVEEAVHSTGFFRNKAKSLQEMAARVTERYGGEVPSAMDDLLTLSGVARKTANVVRGVIWNLADGVVVDTHVKRIARRLGWTKATDPVHVERDLMALHPASAWVDLAHVLIHHGRTLCTARAPRCADCPVAALCPSAPSFGATARPSNLP